MIYKNKVTQPLGWGSIIRSTHNAFKIPRDLDRPLHNLQEHDVVTSNPKNVLWIKLIYK